jgi:hypothetical protein
VFVRSSVFCVRMACLPVKVTSTRIQGVITQNFSGHQTFHFFVSYCFCSYIVECLLYRKMYLMDAVDVVFQFLVRL